MDQSETENSACYEHSLAVDLYHPLVTRVCVI